MVYNTGQPGIDAVRLATGNLLPADYPDTAITGKIKSAYSKIQLGVQRDLVTPFIDGTDVAYDHAVQLEITIAAMYCLKAYGPEFLDKINELKSEAKDDLQILIEGTGATVTEDAIEEIIERTEFKSWNKNPTLSPPNRMLRTPNRIEANF